MSFCICLPNFVVISYNVIYIFQDVAIVGNLLPGSVLVMALIWEDRNLLACQILTRYFNSRLKSNYFRFRKNCRPPYWNFISGCHIDACVVISMSFCICLPNFVVIGQSAAELWRHILFQHGGHRVGNLILGSVLVMAVALIWEAGNLLACKTSMRYVNTWLR